MMSDKEFKKLFRKEASKNYQNYFPVRALKRNGFERHQCKKCGKFFWSIKERDICGDPECTGSYEFIGQKNGPEMGFSQVWLRFSNLLESKGYVPIKRYPVIARWNPSVEFTIASITDFQPYVVSGEVEPIHRMLTVPQICLRFNDIDSVGLTGRHYTGFTMIGQHAFVPKKEFNQEKYFEDYLSWFTEEMKLKKDDLIIHEDAWAGGGNVGACLEFFSKGLEIGNQVYMFFERDHAELKELDIKVLDMGMGQERVSWFLSGKATSYEVVMPSVTEYLFKVTGIKKDDKILKKFVPLSSLLDLDELENSDETWRTIANKIDVNVNKLKSIIFPVQKIYAIADHSRTLLYALTDGALPSNVGGGYNLRVLFRKAMDYGKDLGINLDWKMIFRLHSEDLKDMYPEFLDNYKDITKIIEVEKQKYFENKKKASSILTRFLKNKQEVEEDELIKLYDTFGITPEDVKKEAEKLDVKVSVSDKFYSKISEIHENKEHPTQTGTRKFIEFDEGLPETNKLYFEDFGLIEFDSVVLAVKDNFVVLESSAFYPTSGGQLHDTGSINGIKVVDVFKQGNLIVHKLETKPNFKKGAIVHGNIDVERRTILTQMHTAAHILNGACKKILGNHVWQAGAAKTTEKARLDITHYDSLSAVELQKIEDLANEIIKRDLPVNKYFMNRILAENKFGMTIYQGGAVPGKKLRIVEIPDFDVEACGGTHLNNTSQTEMIKIIKTSKVQDGVIRLEFVAGKRAIELIEKENQIIEELCRLLNCNKEHIPGKAKELFELWKKIVKKKKPVESFELKSKESFEGDVLKETAKILKTQPEHVIKTVKRFIDDVKKRLS